jgi:hypothetical protein
VNELSHYHFDEINLLFDSISCTARFTNQGIGKVNIESVGTSTCAMLLVATHCGMQIFCNTKKLPKIEY